MVMLIISRTGGKEKAKPQTCASCKGAGQVQGIRQVGRGLMTSEIMTCEPCHGQGSVFREKDKCKKCKGACTVDEKKVLEVYIPRGSAEGDKIVLEGEADEQPGYETGNIVFVVDEKEHPVFERSGADLMAKIKVSLLDALCGFERVVVKHLDGRGIKLKWARGRVLKPGMVLRVEGEGMPHKRGEGRGDLYFQVEIVFPEDGWLGENTPEILKSVLPPVEIPEAKGEPVDEIDEIDATANMEEVSHWRGEVGGVG